MTLSVVISIAIPLSFLTPFLLSMPKRYTLDSDHGPTFDSEPSLVLRRFQCWPLNIQALRHCGAKVVQSYGGRSANVGASKNSDDPLPLPSPTSPIFAPIDILFPLRILVTLPVLRVPMGGGEQLLSNGSSTRLLLE
ncbi:hypothetical protein EVAR_66539_1 [Eumeta japonica]|uniref:Uncharacterized protein n=1 Tax=Eumeta variegata TaxID=151549 RepID=A0A4C1ZCG9_EUMVA|nr:hypothetical protein EVAR_66539_1 [Eumeta japonica]